MNFRVLLLGLALCLNTQATYAQDKIGLNELIGLSLAELLQVEIEIASKSSETIFDAPSSVTVFTRQELLNMGLTSVEELLNYIPGFMATRELVFNSGYMVAARGMTTPQASYNILFMVDGQRLNNAVSGGALARNFYIPLANVKQVEVIRGPGSALYGTSAYSGVVNIVTNTDVNNAFFSAGDMASREAYMNFSKQFEQGGYVAGFARYFEDNGQKIYQNVLNPNTLSSDPLKGSDIYLSAEYDRFHFQFRNAQRDRDEFAFFTENLEGIEKYFTEHQSIRLGYELYKTDKFNLNIDFDYMRTRNKETFLTSSLAYLPDSLDKSNLGNLLDGRNAKETEWSINLEGHYAFNDHHELITGLQYRKPTTEYAYISLNYDVAEYNQALAESPPTGSFNYTGIPYDTADYEPQISQNILGIYVQDKYQFNPQWAMTLGLRYDRYSDAGSTTNPRAALTYAPSEKTKFKWMYGEAFRAPSLRQSFTKIQGLGNPDLEPETIKTLELAWLQQFEQAQTMLTYFYSRAENKIDTVLLSSATTGEFLRQFQNLPGALDSAGWEFELSSQLTEHLSLRTAYTYMAKMQEKPQRFSEQTFSAILNYQHDKWNLNLNTYYHDTMQQQIIGGKIKVFDDYWVLHSAVRYALTPELTIVGRIHNLLDETYYNSTKYASVTDGVLNRGRTYSLGIELQF